MLTEYHDTYREFPHAPKAQPIKPNNRTKVSNEPFERSTMYRDIYVPHSYKPPGKFTQAEYVKPYGEMSSSSTYKTDYLEKKAEKPKLAKPNYKPVATDCPFDGNTVNSETYKAWDIPRIESLHPTVQGIRKSSGKFDHRTTVQHDFPGHFGKLARETVKPPDPSLRTGGGPMSDKTTHRLDFDKKNGAPEKSAKPQEQRIQSPGPFDHETTNQNAYTWPQGYAAESCKPVLTALTSEKPFDGDTTHKTTYKKWDIPKIDAWKPQVAWKPNNQSFDNTTTFRHDFQGKQTQKSKSARPEIKRVSPGQFDGTTTHNETYKPWKCTQRDFSRPKAGYHPPSVPFDCQTTHMNDFRGEKAQKPMMCLPRESGIQISGGQEFSTNYGDDYKRKSLPPCPAKDLQEQSASKSGYKFVRDTNGHQFFYPPNAMGMGESIETVALA